MLDPFQPEKASDVKRLKEIQGQIHETFIDQVRERRGSRLSDTDLFTGEFWGGQAAVELGLADGLGHAVPKLKELYGDKVRLVPYQQRRPFFARFGARFGAGMIDEAVGQIEDRAAWARFGL